MKVLIQAGSLGNSPFVEHLMGPLSDVSNVEEILIFCHEPGPEIAKVKYQCPPKILARVAPAAVFYEFLSLFFNAAAKRSSRLAGYKLFPHGLIAIAVAKLTRKPVIVSIISGPVDLYSIGNATGVNYEKSLPFIGKVLRRMLSQSDAIVTTGSFTKNFLIRQGLPESRIFPIIHPADKSRFHQLEVPRVYDIISVGRLIPLKHGELTIQVVAKVKESYPDIKACIVGDGPCKADLVRLANELGVEENVDFAGLQKDTPWYYNRARVLVHSSEREGFPNVVLEAMECGLPCVVSNCGDITDIARDGYNSRVIPKFNDIEAFAKAIVDLLKDEKLYKHLSQNALETMKLLKPEDVTLQWEKVLTACH